MLQGPKEWIVLPAFVVEQFSIFVGKGQEPLAALCAASDGPLDQRTDRNRDFGIALNLGAAFSITFAATSMPCQAWSLFLVVE
jgi:hypothetical protein